MYKKIAITNRKLCKNLLEQIYKLDKSDYDYIILREKDLPYSEYLSLSKEAVKLSNKIILHTYIKACDELNYYKIHLPFAQFKREKERLSNYNLLGVSIHSLEEAVEAQNLGATYITASHIFNTKCKEGLEPKGLKWLSEICRSVKIPVYALGGINEENGKYCIDSGAKGICMMSSAMSK